MKSSQNFEHQDGKLHQAGPCVRFREVPDSSQEIQYAVQSLRVCCANEAAYVVDLLWIHALRYHEPCSP